MSPLGPRRREISSAWFKGKGGKSRIDGLFGEKKRKAAAFFFGERKNYWKLRGQSGQSMISAGKRGGEVGE